MKLKASKHHLLGGSTAKRWIHCPFYIPATMHAKKEGLIPKEQQASFPADKGTAAHALGEFSLNTGCEPEDYYGTIINVEGRRQFTVDDDMIRAVKVYTDFCREQSDELNAVYEATEFNSELSHIFGIDIGGPCDYLILNNDTFGIYDYKNGTFPVEIENNSQFMLYAYGVYQAFRRKYNFKKVRLAVIQPNYNHVDGHTRIQDISIRELKRWGRKVLTPGVERVKELIDVYEDGGIEELNAVAEPCPGDWCAFCPIEGICVARNNETTGLIQADFTENNSKVPAINTLTFEKMERIVKAEKQITSFLKEVKLALRTQIKGGVKSNNFKVVETWSNRKWKNERRAQRKCQKILSTRAFAQAKILSPAQMENALNNVGMSASDIKVFMNALVVREVTGSTIAPVDDGREAISLNPEDDFAEIVATKRKSRN